MPMDGYMSKFKRTYRVYPRLASLQINSSKNALLSEATFYVSTHPVCGKTCDATSLFCLIMDNFGTKMTSMANMKHLVTSLEEHYYVAVKWTGSLFCGVKLMWYYINQAVNS
jgi:hypothetical protein